MECTLILVFVFCGVFDGYVDGVGLGGLDSECE